MITYGLLQVFDNVHPRLGASMTVLSTFGGVDKMISGKTFR